MTPDRPQDSMVDQEEWERFAAKVSSAHRRGLVNGLSRLPSPPRCEACGAPFGGVGGRVMRAIGRAPSRKNPRWCAACFEESPDGGFTSTVGILFIDVRGSTALGASMSPTALVRRLNDFYDRVARVVVRHGLVDKLIGDEVMGIYLPPFAPRGRFVDTILADAECLLRSLGYGSEEGPVLDVGIGIDVGPAYVGSVGRGEIVDFTAIGDVVNTAARLQATAGSGQVVVPECVLEGAVTSLGEGRNVRLTLKGKREPIDVRVLSVDRYARHRSG